MKDKNRLGLNKRVQKKYEGIDLDKAIESLSIDISDVDRSFESFKIMARDRGYEVLEYWNGDSSPEVPKPFKPYIIIIKNDTTGSGSVFHRFGAPKIPEDEKILKNFVVGIHNRRFGITFSFGIGFSAFEPYVEGVTPFWWPYTDEYVESDFFKKRYSKSGIDTGTEKYFKLEEDTLEFLVDYPEKYYNRKIMKVEDLVEAQNLGLNKRIQKGFAKKDEDPVSEFDGRVELYTEKEATDFVRSYAKARGFDHIVESYAFKLSNDYEAKTVFIIPSPWLEKSRILIKITSGPSTNFTTGKETYVEMFVGYLTKSRKSEDHIDHIYKWNATYDSVLTKHVYAHDIVKLFNLAEERIEETLNESRASLGLNKRVQKSFKEEDSVEGMEEETIKSIFIDNIEEALYSPYPSLGSDLGFTCDDADKVKICGEYYPGCELWSIKRLPWYITSILVGDKDGHLKGIEIKYRLIDRPLVNGKNFGRLFLSVYELPTDIVDEIEKQLAVDWDSMGVLDSREKYVMEDKEVSEAFSAAWREQLMTD